MRSFTLAVSLLLLTTCGSGSKSLCQTKNIKWGLSASPLVDGDLVLALPGAKGAAVAAFNKKTGDTLWQTAVPGGDPAAYASVIIGQVGAVKQYIQFLQNGVVGVDAE